MESKSDTYSIHSLSFQQSIRNQTKQKFDKLLKDALNKSNGASKELLMTNADESTTASSENLLDVDEGEIAKMECDQINKDFILNKFLSDSGRFEGDIMKPPVPKPRKKIPKNASISSNSSKGTFKVTSPKIYKNVMSAQSVSSSSKTYILRRVEDSQTIGDLVLHNSPTNVKIPVLSHSTEILEKHDSEKNIEDLSHTDNCTTEHNHVRVDNVVSGKDLNEDSLENMSSVVTSSEKVIEKNYTNEGNIAKIGENKNFAYQKIVEILIHRTDKLLLKSFIVHPVVQVHIVDVNSGKYYLKSDKSRHVVFFYENDQNDYILPIMSQSYSLQENRTVIPSWEESIIINEDFNYFLNEHIIVFFEIMDFIPTYESSLQRTHKNHKGWRRIAYAFFRPVGKNNISNCNRKVRLQLYHPPQQIFTKQSQKCYIWDWWKNRKRTKYPSSIYVSIREKASPEKIVNAFRSKTPLEKENDLAPAVDDVNMHGDASVKESICENTSLNNNMNKDASRKKIIDCFHMPNVCLTKIETYEEGCFLHKFSNNGLYLACVLKTDDMFCVFVYSVRTFEEVKKFVGHRGLIYALNWSRNDSKLITGSADNTVCIWDYTTESIIQILPHPNYVYASEMHEEYIIATGCYDTLVRIWTRSNNSKYELFQELEKHKGYITCICINKAGTHMYSCDAVGAIIEWTKSEEWEFSRFLPIFELKGIVINQILLFPNNKKILVHSRDSILRIVSLKSSCVLHWLQGALNRRVQTFSSISSCGNFVTAGSENGIVMVWNAKTGFHVKSYDPFSSFACRQTIHCSQFHPSDSIISVSHYGSNFPIIIYCYKDGSQETECNVELKGKTEIKIENSRPHSSRTSDKRIDFVEILDKMDSILK